MREVLFQTGGNAQDLLTLVSSIGMTLATCGQASVRVPVLSKTMVSVRENVSKNFPPFTIILWFAASCIAEITQIGVESFKAQE